MTGDVVTDFKAMHEFFLPYGFQGKNQEWSCNEPAEHPEVYLK